MTGDPGALAALLRAPFYKMSGSGNDFVFLDARDAGAPVVLPADRIAALCARGTGVGADGVVVLDQPAPGGVRITYRNSDGSRAALCGNATLCTASLAVHLGAVPPGADFVIVTDAGRLTARVTPGLGPSFELAPVSRLTPDAGDRLRGAGGGAERRIGYGTAGVPHVIVRVGDVAAVDLLGRSPELRAAAPGRPDGANVNYVSPADGGVWHMRTFERGVEGETLACGTGAVTAAAMLRAWGEVGDEVELRTRSGRSLTVTLRGADQPATLAGEGRLIFVGTLGDPG